MQAPNFGNFFGATQSAWYPMGVAAGKMTKTNKLGFVIGVPIGYAVGNINAFELGARSVNPKAQTRVVVTGGWSDKAKEAAAANALIDQGADVVAMHVDSPATIIQIAEAAAGYSIGFQSLEARALAPKGWITGLGFTWGPFMTETAKSVIAGTFKPAMVRLGLGQGMIAVAPFGTAVPADVRELVTAAADRIGKGFNPFTGPVADNTGAVRIKEGEVLGRRQDGQLRLVRGRRDRQGQMTIGPTRCRDGGTGRRRALVASAAPPLSESRHYRRFTALTIMSRKASCSSITRRTGRALACAASAARCGSPASRARSFSVVSSTRFAASARLSSVCASAAV